MPEVSLKLPSGALARTVADVMTAEVATVRAEASLEEALELMRLKEVTALPVRRSGVLVGIITERDLRLRAIRKGVDLILTRVQEIMTPQIAYVGPDWALARAIQTMEALRVPRVAVLDGRLRLVGMLDLRTARQGALAE